MEFAVLSRYEGYRFGVDGTVWSRWVKDGWTWSPSGEWRKVTVTVNHDGYARAKIMDSVTGKRDTVSLHSLILEAFKGPRPRGLVARHLNGKRRDARLCNLEYATQRENLADMKAHGTIGSTGPKLTFAAAEAIREEKARGVTTRAIADRIGLTVAAVNKVARGATWRTERGG